jgi:molecular chaperone GrpE
MATDPTDPQSTSSETQAAESQTTGSSDELAGAQARIAALEKELADARERADRFHANWQRSAADFQNWKRRTDQEKAETGRNAEGALTVDLLRVLDDFDRAFMALPLELRALTWVEGVYMIGQKLYAVLQSKGLSPIEAAGQEFDPYLHEAVLREEGAEGSEQLVVVQELQRGYRFHERVIRPTMVKVGPPPSGSATPADASSPLTDEATPDSTVVDAEATPTTGASGSAPTPETPE